MWHHRLFLSALLVLALHGNASAQAWPTKPLRAIVPFPAGGANDVIARTIFEQLSPQLGQPIVTENRSGAAGTLGAAAVAKADPDGYTLLVPSSAHTIAPSIYPNLPYDTARDFSAVIPLASLPNVLVVAPTKGVKTVQEFVAAAKASPRPMTYGSSGLGAPAYLITERFRLGAGFEAQHVPFKGAPEALTEVLAGRVDFFFSPILPALPFIRDGKLIPLAVSSLHRSSALPDTPTTLEAGFANTDYNLWVGIFLPSATRRDIVNKLHQEILQILQRPTARGKLQRLAAEPMILTPAAFDALVREEIAKNAELINAVTIKAH